MAEAVLVIDPVGEVLLSNPAAEKMLRYRPGMNVQSLRVAEPRVPSPTAPRRCCRRTCRRRGPCAGEQFDEQEIIVRPLRGGHEIHLVISGRPIREKSGAIGGAALVYHDITASRDTERRLREAQKLEAIGKLTGGVAHDFNNMLTVITGTRRRWWPPEGPAGFARGRELIDDAAERCAELIKHLLAFARKQPLQPHNVDINKAVADIAKLLRPTLGEQIEIATDPRQGRDARPYRPIPARQCRGQHGDQRARRHAERRQAAAGDRATPCSTRPTSPPIRTCWPGHYVMLAISDTGTGMPPEVLEQRLRTVLHHQGYRQGHGARTLHGLWLRQAVGRPHQDLQRGRPRHRRSSSICRRRRGASMRSRKPIAEAAGGSETILVVEDDALVRGFVITQLKKLGYKTISANDARAAWRWSMRGEPFDLLFTDVVMPGGMSGRELAASRGQAPAGCQGALYVGLYGQRYRAPRPARRRRAAADQALPQAGARADGAAGAGWRRRWQAS